MARFGTCPKCGSRISLRAASCPECGEQHSSSGRNARLVKRTVTTANMSIFMLRPVVSDVMASVTSWFTSLAQLTYELVNVDISSGTNRLLTRGRRRVFRDLLPNTGSEALPLPIHATFHQLL